MFHVNLYTVKTDLHVFCINLGSTPKNEAEYL
jgi:hypothetical protein